MNFKVMTFNLRVDIAQDNKNAWKYRCENVAKIIMESEALIIGTQEGLPSMIKELAEKLDEFTWVGEGRLGQDKDEHCAVFYDKQKLEAMDHGTFWLSETPEAKGSTDWGADYPRICTWVHFCWKDEPEKQFFLYNTHLDHISQIARERGMALIKKKMQISDNQLHMPMVLMGDMNAKPSNPAIRLLKESSFYTNTYDFLDSTQFPLGKTFHDFEGGSVGEPIDYIFTYNNVPIHGVEIHRNKINNSYPSDHYPVIATISM
ncbi:endonuclease/exonuclease/phosphatase family protein [Lentibacillus sediminis]|uniref:endonuclease/exonuclease/phosphatase family protein n=1 Tax=Lentibacillus sediminis TaxID=1940529 RepID=UPI000C1C0E41|nr:endonuclease/exonuclease/phosphatase family protein [Lentibacillus sediminis]